MSKPWLILYFILGTLSGRAQLLPQDTLESVIILKVTPLALFDLDNTLQFGVEVPFRNQAWTVQQEAGYGHSAFNLWYRERRQYPDRETWRFRTQLRYYFRRQNQSSPYIAGEYLFKKNSEEKFESVGMDCVTGQFGNRQCAYFQNRPTHLFRFVNAFHIKWGWQFTMGERWYFDTYIGLGLRALRIRYLNDDDFSPGFNRDFLSIRIDRPGIYQPTPSFSTGVHFGYRL